MITNISSGIKKKYVDEQDDALAAQISGKAPTNHASSGTTYGVSTASVYGHAMASSTTPKANGTAAVGTETAKFARGDHVHPLQTTVSGNAGSATKLATARTIKINGESSGVPFNGTADIMLTKSALRHESIETTQIYIQTEEDKMRSAINSIEKIIIY